MNEQQRQWLRTIQRELSESVERIDPVTLARLRTIRRKALAQRAVSFNRPWLWLSGGAIASAVAGILAFVLLSSTPLTPSVPAVEDLELLATSEDIEFYDNLEFYQWLELEHGRSG